VRGLAGVLAVVASITARAESLPLWEFGAGLTGLRLPDYRGSAQSHDYLLPLPWFVYRGPILRADRDGVRARLFDTDRAELEVSVSGSVPVRSDRNDARHGMPNLHATLEIGPALNLHLWRSGALRATSVAKVDLRLPLRAALTYRDGRPQSVGWIASPHLNLDLKLPPSAAAANWNVGIQAGPVIADRRFNAYYYDVASEYATAVRPAYRASGGYGGWQALASLSWRSGPWWVGGFVKYDDVSGAVFAGSPLVTARSHLSGGLAFAYVFAASDHRVDAQ
jgi:outer membrane scaffolding protein for murein synthesis (MipA/OmpV family)